ncbi:hypothetical protein COS91_01835 [Candidatus Desantisbacteria bacterium CG07_land_8_20_14_0_80_39_15]|uniref:DUF262 domain-containing protein n=1 Tax=Candidatus Desantisbacteria bacterium CG07_land_8_20_14_0_80_39_15 TaxID=1974549 RepID=A0A2M6ZHR0_9BACT|nr:MAG: hypothetical protein COS91_01835 [Candidatus Desantisbacteria bacterium CG07_land_8_20_14_0_80_39_15]
MTDVKQLNVKPVKMLDLLNEAFTGALVIPDFQRDFVWARNQVEELLNSVINNYFIGSILLLETSSEKFGYRLIKGVDPQKIQKISTIKYVLDGQQRLTSLFYAFFEPNVPLIDLICKFYFRADTQDIFGMEDPEDIARRLRLGKQYKEKLLEILTSIYGDVSNLPTMGIFNNKEVLNQYFGNIPNLDLKTKGHLQELFEKIQQYTIPVIILPLHTSDEDIVNIFERINRTGTPLGIFELAVARYHPQGIKLNELKQEIKNNPILEILGAEAVLKVMALLQSREPKSKNLIGLLDTQKSKSENQAVFYTLWKSAVTFLERALKRMREVYGASKIKVGKRNLDLVPYTSMLIPLAVLLHDSDKKGNTKVLFDKVDFWYWTSVFMQRYTHAVDSKSFSDVRSIQDWFEKDESPPNLSCNCEYIRGEMLKAARSSALGKGFYELLILNGCKDLLTGQDVKITECHIDHLFPSSKFPKANNIFNLTILDKNTNQRKKDKLPSEFIAECLESHGDNQKKFIKTLESHFISEKALEAIKGNSFDEFIQARADLFISTLKERTVVP